MQIRKYETRESKLNEYQVKYVCASVKN